MTEWIRLLLKPMAAKLEISWPRAAERAADGSGIEANRDDEVVEGPKKYDMMWTMTDLC